MKTDAEDGVEGVDLRLPSLVTRDEPVSALPPVIQAVWRAGGRGFLELDMGRIAQVGGFGQYQQTSMSTGRRAQEAPELQTRTLLSLSISRFFADMGRWESAEDDNSYVGLHVTHNGAMGEQHVSLCCPRGGQMGLGDVHPTVRWQRQMVVSRVSHGEIAAVDDRSFSTSGIAL